uniref:Eukaryotic translation initiation factor 2-alpha kinase 1 n=1 Tax=Hippocampus comes TaxID=109280 RepID=A0A3Q2Y1H4_HIPCM
VTFSPPISPASDTDSHHEVLMAGRRYPSVQEFASAIPNHLLLGSLLEHLCFVYESNPARSRMLFKVIGQRLASMNLLSPLAISDEFSTVRLQHNRAFAELMSECYEKRHTNKIRDDWLFQTQTSRYLSEFEEVGRIGKGSYGNVYKVVNKLDGQCYAVKKILIKKVSKEDCMKVLREVKVLSSLQHVNIVGYHTAWMEHVQPTTCEDTPAILFFIFCCCCWCERECGCNLRINLEWQNFSHLFDSSPRMFRVIYESCYGLCCAQVHLHLMLYIQMQLCERSLKDWMTERNLKPREERASRCIRNHTFSLLRKILEGVEYIHSRGIIHRDLKPRNIFLNGHDRHVRIGDFGLACSGLILDSHENSPHTTGVGTFVYASPEQLKSPHYDSKSDMYSIGVLALELFQPFGTEMERVQTLGDLREGKIPDCFSNRWPVLANYILKLTSIEPSVRPTTSQLLQSELFCNKDVVICGLQRKVEEQEEEILHLRKQIQRLQSSHSTFPNCQSWENT